MAKFKDLIDSMSKEAREKADQKTKEMVSEIQNTGKISERKAWERNTLQS